jgi:transporter family protein
MWLLLGLASALLLGIYDVSKKISLDKNAVVPVLLVSVTVSSLILLPFVLLSLFAPQLLIGTIFFVPKVDITTHFYIFIKAVIVLTSWIFAYFAVKHLPISIASPIKATQPMWTVLGAFILFGETLNFYQASGIVLTLFSFFMFSVVGKKEGISFRTNKWFIFIVIATLTGAVSGLYDKYLMKLYNPMSVQAYYTFYQLFIMCFITWFLWRPTKATTTKFQFRWSIVFISIFLVSADFLYFYALTLPDSLISVLSTIRRAGVIVPFLYGMFVMHDKNLKAKLLDLVGVLLGMYLLYLGSR